MFHVFCSMGIHLVHVSFAAAEVAKRFPRLLGRYACIDHAPLVASGFLLAFFLGKKEAASLAAVIDKLNWRGSSSRLKWKSSKNFLIVQSLSQVRTYSIQLASM